MVLVPVVRFIIVNHDGATCNSGPYTADLLVNESDCWRCDDMRVKNVRGLYGSSEVYLLFCELVSGK